MEINLQPVLKEETLLFAKALEQHDVFAEAALEVTYLSGIFDKAAKPGDFIEGCDEYFKLVINLTASEAMDVDKEFGDNYVETTKKKREAVMRVYMDMNDEISHTSKETPGKDRKHIALEGKTKKGLRANPGFDTMSVA